MSPRNHRVRRVSKDGLNTQCLAYATGGVASTKMGLSKCKVVPDSKINSQDDKEDSR